MAILFYNKENGNIFSVMDGRVHTKQNLNEYVTNGDVKEVGKYIIGYVEDEEGNRVAFNLDQIELLEKFDNISEVSPLDYKIKNGKLIKK